MMKKSFILMMICVSVQGLLNAQDLVSGGSNQWTFHTPDDGRTSLFITPFSNSGNYYNWDSATIFSSNGDVTFSHNTYMNGSVGIGTLTPSDKLAVNGKIRAKEIRVEVSNWPDYVFKPSYRLMPLSEVEDYIKAKGHLPDVPSSKDVAESGIEVGRNQAVLLKKIEELTLHLIEMEKVLKAQRVNNEKLSEEIAVLKKSAKRKR